MIELKTLCSERGNKVLFQILGARDGNANTETSIDTNTDGRFIFSANLNFESITTEYVGKYYCVFNSSVRDESKTNYDLEVQKNRASSIYVFVDGET